ncbi:outer membrane beta-barrel protein [Sandaracinus amylolyticus]|uniref:outer membrane beta-barrel protein n=1 Tax=Sandaracinus amylolyticus TaxID=927083 RepID=UPI0012EE6F83|nr:outer membrane beta-barrel protein [Sandaracinus amylolyticus]
MNLRQIGFALAIAALVIASTARTAAAQGWLEDRDRAEGPGIRLGDFELHPGIGLEVGWDSNVYYTSDDPAPGLPQRVDSAILRVTPHLLFSTLGAERRAEGEGAPSEPPVVQFRGGLSASYYEFFADERRRNVAIDIGLNLSILQGRPVSFTLYNQFGRSIRPFTENTSNVSYARIREDAGLQVMFSTAGQILQVGVGYDFGLDFFEDEQLQYGNTFNHAITLSESFRFLPQTALVHTTSVIIRDYYQPPGAGSDRPAQLDSVRLNSMLGVNGAITNEISFMVQGGYGAGFFESIGTTYDQDFDTFLARAELRWRPMQSFRLSFGYDRSVHPSFVGNYYSQDRGYINTQMMFGGAFLLGADLSLAYYDFGQIVAPDGVTPIGNSTERTDVRFIGSLFAEYRFTEWLGVNGTFRYTGSFTDFSYDVPVGGGAVVLDPAQYNKIELWLGVRVFY